MRRLVSIALGMGMLAVVACAPVQVPASAPAAVQPTTPALIPLKVGVALTPAPALPESTLWLARDLGFYQKEGLDVTLTEVDATPSVITAMRTGDVDVGDINTEDVIRLTASKDLEMRTINSASGRNFFMIVGKNNIGSVMELQGKSFAIARVGSQDHALSSKVLAAKGVPASGVNYVAVGAPNVRAQALVAGQIDATTVSLGTWVTIQSQPNIKQIVGVDDYYNSVPLVNKGNAVTLKVLNEKSEALRRFTVALIKTSRYLAENKSAWVDGMSKLRPDIARTDLEYLWDQFGASWGVNGQLNVGQYQTSTDFLYDQGSFPDLPKIDAKTWTDTEFVDAALKDLGVYPNVAIQAALSSEQVSPPKIDVVQVSKTFRRLRGKVESSVAALRDVSLQIMPGEFVCLVGPSGCGKTTLLRLIDGLLEPDSGYITIDGGSAPAPGPQAGFVFQSFRLLPWRTVLDNVEFPLEIQQLDKHLRHERAMDYVRLVGLEGFEHSYPHELSGGMQQRVGLARALALEPQILLMDEPFAALDAQTREFMQMELSRIWQSLGIAVVFVTHSLDEALYLGDRIVLMGPRPGHIQEVLSVHLPRPRWEYDFRATPEFIDRRGYLWRRIRDMVADQPEFRLAQAAQAGTL